MKKRQIMRYVHLAMILLMLIMQLVAIISIARLKMLPGILMALIILVFIGYAVAAFWFMFLRGKAVPRKAAKRVAKRRRIIAGVMAVVMICGCGAITSVVSDVMKAIASVQVSSVEPEETGIKRAIYIRTHDQAQSLEDTATYVYGKLVQFDEENTRQAVEAIEARVGTTLNTKDYSSVFDMTDALLSGELDAVILSSDYLSVLENESRFASFDTMTRVLEEVTIEGSGEELDQEGLLLNAEAPIAENGKLKPFVVYISGSDSRSNSMYHNRSDVNILMVANPQTRQILLVNTPRDSYVPSTEEDGAMEKLSHAGIFGINSSIESMETLYDQEINYYVQVSFGGLVGLIDAIGGITVYSDQQFTMWETMTKIKVGENHLNGTVALDYARNRVNLEGGDRARGNHQMDIIKAVIEKATSGTTIINNYPAILASLEGLFVTDIPTVLISTLVKEQLADMSGWNIVSYAATGEGANEHVYSIPGYTTYVMVLDEATVTKGAKLIDLVMEGEILTNELVNSVT